MLTSCFIAAVIGAFVGVKLKQSDHQNNGKTGECLRVFFKLLLLPAYILFYVAVGLIAGYKIADR